MKAPNSLHATGFFRRLGAVILLATLFGSGVRAGAQGALLWYSGPDLPSPRAETAAVLAPDDAVLLLGGTSPAGDTVVPKLGSGAAVWTTALETLDKSRKAPGVARFGADGILVFGGTKTTGGGTDEALLYDYWFADSQDADQMSTVRQQFAFAADANGNAYAIGGLGESNVLVASAERYDPVADAWTALPPLPAARQGAVGVAVGNTHVYVMGGAVGASIFATTYRYNIAQGTWQQMAAMPVAVKNSAAVFAEGKLYVLGGVAATGRVATVQVFDIAGATWSTATDMPAARSSHSAVLRADARILVAGGYDASGNASASIFQTQILNLPDAAPEFTSTAVTTAALDVAYTYDVNATGQPAATFSLVAAPAGMTIDATSGVISWVPVFGQQGNQAVIVRASNRAGQADQAFAIAVMGDVLPIITSAAVTSASLDRAYSYDVNATGSPVPTYSLVAAPAGMSIDGTTGLISWQPAPGQQGTHVVTVRAAHRSGQADQTFNILVVTDTIAPTPPTEVHVVEVTASSVTLAWSGATDATGVDHFAVYRQYRCGWRGSKRCYALVQGNIFADTMTISGLPPLTTYTYAVRTFDAAGNQSVNSPLVTFKTLSPPTSLRYTGATSLPANFPLQLQFWVNANPAATFSVVSGPAGLTLDPETGVASWLPSPADVGTHTLVVRATNSGGTAELSVDITVRPDVPVLSVQFVQGAGGWRDAVAGSPWTAQVLDASHTTSTYEIVAAPPGMTIDTVTGQLSWTPTPDDAGLRSVTVRATNAAASTDITLEFYAHFTGPVLNLQVTGLTDLYPTATWSPPVGIGADRVAGYTIVAKARYRYGRAYRTHQVSYETDGETPTVTLTGLVSSRSYTLSVNAVDEIDNRGLLNLPAPTFVPRPGLPVVGWTISNANGNAGVVAGQEAVVQFTDYNPTFGPASYSIVSAPAGFVLDPVTGEGRWTPAATDIGTVPVTIRVTNQIGPRDVTVNILVNFSGPVRNPIAVRNGDNAVASWQPPLDNVLPIASYRVTMHWQWGSRSYSRSMTATGTSLAFSLIPTGAVWHKGVTITPLDATGRTGVYTALIPYNGALPPGLPSADPAWIEQVTIGADGTPVVEVRGPVGAVAELEVSSDLSIWDPLETVTVGDEGVMVCPDSVSQNVGSMFYRLKVP